MAIRTHKCAHDHCSEQIPLKTKYCSRACLLQAHEAHHPKAPVVKETITEGQNTREITKAVGERVRTLADLVRVCEIDTETWEVERWLCNKWDMAAMPKTTGTSKNWERSSTTPIVTEIYQVKAWLTRKTAVIEARAEIDALIERAKERMIESASVPPIPYQSGNGTRLLEISLPDLHAGMLAWAKETGWANYDTKIAREVFTTAVRELVARTKGHTFKRIVFVVGNDLMNADNMAGTTTMGTQQDVDVRFQKTFGIVRDMVIDAVELLRGIAPVDVVMVPGNHDRLSVWHLGDSLQCYFHTYPDVCIDNTPRERKYYLFGKVMLLFTHGDKGSHPDYPLVMATEEPGMFGATTFREAHVGHHHTTKVSEYHGVKVRILPALTAYSAWAASKQYVGNARTAEAFVWDADEGLVATALYTIPSK